MFVKNRLELINLNAMMKKDYLYLGMIIIAAALLRFVYCYQMPVSGDECITLLQASGKACIYQKCLTEQPIPVEQFRGLINYSDDYSIPEVLQSMRTEGMHPPLYYCLFHYLLKFAGNSVLAVRLPSILFSTGSVLLLYFLFRTLFPDIRALPTGLFLAVSTYGIHYAHMVRPYPLMMFLSLLSTLLLVRMCANRTVELSSMMFWGYIFTAAAGFYTLYHFIFVFLFQMVYVLLVILKSKRQILVVLIIPLLVGLIYLPWIPSFIDQLKTVNSGQFYFHGCATPFNVYRYFLEYDFTQALPGRYAWYKFILAFAITAATGAGIARSFKTLQGRCFAAAMAGYICFNTAADWKMQTITLNIPKLLFFVIPILFLYFSAGISLLIKFNKSLGLSCIAMISFILAINSTAVIRNPTAEDDPRLLSSYRWFITETADPKGSTLLVVNETSRRYTLPLAHTIHVANLEMLAAKDIIAAVRGLDLSKYSRAYCVSPRYNNVFAAERAQALDAAMKQNDFLPDTSAAAAYGLTCERIMLYKKQ